MAMNYNLIRSALRRVWLRFPARTEALQKAKRPYVGPNKRQQWEYQCNKCKAWFMAKNVAVDHIIPVGSFLKPTDWQSFGTGLFCDSSNLQILCKDCHKIKTAQERAKK